MARRAVPRLSKGQKATVALASLAVCAIVMLALHFSGVFSDKDKPTAPTEQTAPTATPAPTQAPPPPSPLLGPPGPPVQVVTCETKLADAEWGQAGGASVRGRKVSLVGQLYDGSDACTDEAVKKVVERNKDKLFQSAYKMESQDGASIYYLSQFVDSKIPAALSEPDRLSYKKLVGKTPGQKGNFEGAADAPGGLQCELITGQDVSTKDKVETVCSNDDRCVGYYTSSTTGLNPVMAMAANGGCTLSWMKLPSADQPTETDVCKKFMGDKAWAQKEEGWCFPNQCNYDSQAWGGLCKDCPAGWGKCSNCSGYKNKVCFPLTEDTCPVGWRLDRTDGDFPGGVCKPVCDGLGQKGPHRHPWTEFCSAPLEFRSRTPGDDELKCEAGYSKSWHGQNTWTALPHYHFCRPASDAIKTKFYKAS